MNHLNNYARHFLFTRLFLPMGILVLLDAVIFFLNSEAVARQFTLFLSVLFFMSSAIAIIFYPRFMKFSFHLARYDKYLDGIIKSYEEWLSDINNRITVAEKLPIKHFMIGHKKKRAQTPEIITKLLAGAKTNKEGILGGYNKERDDVEKQLDFYKKEKMECSKLLTTSHEKNNRAS